MISYFDTAYILKCYVKEHGWRKVRTLAQSHDRIACSVYGRLELHAALHRKLREGELTDLQLNIILRQLSVDESTRLWEWLPLSSAIINAVTNMFTSLPRHVFLRAGDAVHLLSARMNGFAEIYSNDKRLLAAASHIDMTGHDVIEPAELPGGAV